MVRSRWIFAMMILLVFSVAACSSLNQVTPAEIDDEALEADVRAAILDDTDLNAFSFGVDVNDGVVTVSGSVDTAAQRTRVAEAVRRVDGVRTVINNVTVR